MNDYDFFSDFLTFQLFDRLERFPDNVKFEWFKMSNPLGYRYGRQFFLSLFYGNPSIYLSDGILNNLKNNHISDTWFTISEICFNDFVDMANRKYNIIGVEVGIHKIVISSSPVVSPLDGLEYLRIFYSLAPIQFGVENNSGKKRLVKKPKPYKL